MVLVKLQQVMERKGISTEDLASLAMMSSRSIFNAKGRGVSLTTAKRIAKALKCSLDDLKDC